jgi:hypothetical protein
LLGWFYLATIHKSCKTIHIFSDGNELFQCFYLLDKSLEWFNNSKNIHTNIIKPCSHVFGNITRGLTCNKSFLHHGRTVKVGIFENFKCKHISCCTSFQSPLKVESNSANPTSKGRWIQKLHPLKVYFSM